MSPSGVGQSYVLVVEDDAGLRQLYRTTLRQAGFAVIAVEDGLGALHRIEVEKPRAIILDLGLPRVGGRDVLHELQARPETNHIPIVVVSGNDTHDLNPKDFACILRKPVTPDELVAAVHNCVAKWRRVQSR